MTCQLNLRFTSNFFGNGLGFRIMYTVQSEVAPSWTFRMGACGGNFTTPSGILTSPSYPENYPNNAECIYTISQPNGTVINLSVTDLEVDNYRDSFFSFNSYYYDDDTCQTDYLEIRDGSTQESTLIEYLCGNETTAPILSTQGNVWMR